MTTNRHCTVCRIRETADYPFPSADWDLCWNHGTEGRNDNLLTHDEWLALMIDRYGMNGETR